MQRLIGVLALSAPLLIGQVPNPVTSGSFFDIAGTVLDASTGRPVTRAQITLQPEQAGNPQETLSDDSGGFEFRHVALGAYRLVSTKRGYAGGDASYRKVILVGGTQPDRFTLKLQPQAVLGGSVVDQNNEPIAEARVLLLRPEFAFGHRKLGIATTTQTDDQGKFRFYGLGGGRAYVEAVVTANGAELAHRRAYPPTLYPNSTELPGAQIIDLQPDAEQQISIQLTSEDCYRIHGQLNPAVREADIELRPTPANEGMEPPAQVRFNARDASFDIDGVTAGDYLITVEVDTGGKKRVIYHPLSVDGDQSNITLDLTAAQPLTGTVTAEGGQPARHAATEIQFRQGAAALGGAVQANGTFQIGPLPPGVWRIEGVLAPGWYIKAATLAGADLLSQGLTSRGESLPGALQVLVSPRGGTLEATVTWPDQGDRSPAVVTILQRQQNEMVRVASAQVAAPNEPAVTRPALIGGLPPGDYIAYAFPEPVDVEYSNPEALRPLESFAEKIHVDEKGQSQVALKIAIAP